MRIGVLFSVISLWLASAACNKKSESPGATLPFEATHGHWPPQGNIMVARYTTGGSSSLFTLDHGREQPWKRH